MVNDRGELVACCLTPDNVEDRRPVPPLLRRIPRLFGKRFADRGYISQPLAEHRFVEYGVHLITKLRKHRRNRLLDVADKLLLLCKRAIIETISDQLQHICQIEHTRHRSPVNCLLNLVAGLIASCHQPKTPSLALDPYRLPAASVSITDVWLRCWRSPPAAPPAPATHQPDLPLPPSHTRPRLPQHLAHPPGRS